MRLPQFDFQAMKWDKYKQFHHRADGVTGSWGGGFVSFISGELLCVRSDFAPGDRQAYPEFNLEIIGTGDEGYPQLYDPDGGLILKAWLTDGGAQMLLYDRDTHKVVCLAGSLYYSREWDIPKWARNECTAYFAGPGRSPVGAPVKVSRPHTWSREEWRHVDSLRVGCEAWAKFERAEPEFPRIPAGWKRGQHPNSIFTRELSWEELLAAPNIEALSEDARTRVAQFGFTRRRDITSYPYLTSVEGTPQFREKTAEAYTIDVE